MYKMFVYLVFKDESDVYPLNTKYFTENTVSFFNPELKCDKDFGHLSDESIPGIVSIIEFFV